MRLLVDANLSWRLVRLLQSHFTDVTHLKSSGLSEDASDIAIWNFALENQYTIITNDEDFNLLTMSKGFPPKVVLLRTGNQSTSFVAEVISKHANDIKAFLADDSYGVLEIY